jgi:hypothetical protein
MEVIIDEVVSRIRAVDGQALLSPAITRELVRLTLEAVRAEREHEMRREAETRLACAGGGEPGR